jgi:hypothetical protein
MSLLEPSAAWVAGSVRARAMARRRLGAEATRALAASPTLAEAVEALSRSPYGRAVRPGDGLDEAQRGVAETLLWNVRVLAGWLPARGAQALRVLAGWFEIANVDEHLRVLAGEPASPPYRLGSLATAWPRLARTGSLADLRVELATSAWGDPGGETVREVQLCMRLAWAERAAGQVAAVRPLALGGVALVAAREVFARGMPLPGRAGELCTRLLGPDWAGATSIDELAARLAPPSRWALRGVDSPADLWRAEAQWWARLARDGRALLAGSGFGLERAIGAVALLAADAWQVRAALAAAARGGRAREVFDAVA